MRKRKENGANETLKKKRIEIEIVDDFLFLSINISISRHLSINYSILEIIN